MVGCDTGGTFTDFVAFDSKSPSGNLRVYKTSSTPGDPSQAVLAGLARLPFSSTVLNHASTVATNALLEGKGSTIALLVSKGFSDLLTLGRGARRSLYNLNPESGYPLAHKIVILEVEERMAADGSVLTELTELEITRIKEALTAEAAVEALAVCLLHSSTNPAHEKILGDHLDDLGMPIFLSHLCAPGSGEFERASTCCLAAILTREVSTYVSRLARSLPKSKLWLVHSGGGLLTPQETQLKPHRLALSGPAAGLRGALEIGRTLSLENLVTLDMGGTSTDVALIEDGQLPYRWTTEIAELPLRAPTLEIHTVGAGGGSIAHRDAGGLLRVGPGSAGAEPGPACYGRGGEEATVTDALCYLGYLPDQLGDDALVLSRERSSEVLSTLAEDFSMTPKTLALGILDIAVVHLCRAVRKVTTGKGRSPQRFTLLPYGGAGPLLACRVAEKLDISTILVPLWAGVLSAWGALVAPWEGEWSAQVPQESRQDPEKCSALFQRLAQETEAERQGLGPLQEERLVARRYVGQGEALHSSPEVDFHQHHLQVFGFCRPEWAVETVEVRLRFRGPGGGPKNLTPKEQLALPTEPLLAEREIVLASGVPRRVPVLHPGDSKWKDGPVNGPLLTFASTFTLWVEDGWSARQVQHGHLLIERSKP